MILNDTIDIQNENDAVKEQRIQNTKLNETEVVKRERKGYCSNCSIF